MKCSEVFNCFYLRAESDGQVYFGCVHIMCEGSPEHLKIGNLEQESFEDIFEKVASGKSELVEAVSYVDEKCASSPCYEICRGGDRMRGYVHRGRVVDPYCEKIR